MLSQHKPAKETVGRKRESKITASSRCSLLLMVGPPLLIDTSRSFRKATCVSVVVDSIVPSAVVLERRLPEDGV
jgi:hypothetical protein